MKILMVTQIICILCLMGLNINTSYQWNKLKETSQAEIATLQTEIANLERTQGIPEYIDPDLRELELIEQIVHSLQSANGTIKYKEDGIELEINFSYAGAER